MANIKVDLKYSGIEQTQIQEYEKDIIRIHESFYLKEKDRFRIFGLAIICQQITIEKNSLE